MSEPGDSAVEGAVEAKAENPGLDLTTRWVTFTEEELSADPPRKEFVWDHRIPLGDVGVLAAEGGGGKTSLLTGLAIHRAMGRHFLGAAVRQGTTVIVTAEDGALDYRRRIRAWSTAVDFIDLAAVARHVHVVDLSGVPFRLVQSQFGDFVPTGHPKMLADVIRKRAPEADLIVIETTSRVGAGESNEALAALVVAAEQLAKLTGASVLLVAHVSQEAARRGTGDAHAPRGGTALGANGRFTLTLAKLTQEAMKDVLPGVRLAPEQRDGLSVLRVAKINACAREAPTILRADSTPWGLTLRVHDAAQTRSLHERVADQRRSIGAALQAMASKWASVGNPLTQSQLSDGAYKEISGLAKGRVSTAVTEALEDGYLVPAPRKGRGGGMNLLPGEKREGSEPGSDPGRDFTSLP